MATLFLSARMWIPRQKKKTIKEDLYEREKKEEIRDKERDPEKLLQELFIIYNALSQKIALEKEITSDVDAVLEPGNLALDLIEGIYKEVLTKKKLEKEKIPIFETYQKFTETSHEVLIEIKMGEVELKVIPMKSGDKMKKFDVDDTDKPCKEDKGGIKKDNEFNRIMSVDSEFTGKTTIVSKVKLGKFGQKKKMETVLIMPREIVGGKTQEEDDHNPLTGDEKGSVEEKHKGKHERPLDGEALGHTCNLWRREVIRNTEYAEEKEHKAFKHFKSEKTETVNKVNVPEVYQKKAEGSLYKNGDEKVSVVEERFLHIDSSVDKELGKDRIEIRKVKGKAKANLEAQVRLGSCYQKRSGPRRRLSQTELVHEEKEPIQEPRGEINIKKGKKKDYKKVIDKINLLTKKEKLDRTCEVWMRKIKKFQETATLNRGRVEEPTEETFDRIYEAECRVKKNEDKEIKVETELSMTYPKPTKVDYANRIKDPEDGRTSIRIEKDVEEGKSMISAYYQKSANNESDILALNGRGKTRCCIDGCEKAIANQDKSLKVEVKDASA
ncbi:hypothetical protein C2G38_2046829 [Gigaspora rosea]|uniref:Uncharacterized protein n=1 Tax=Gigaspora rosea TaxID=44941 RepID=A0A397UGW7_9GLOM|nr:hypothetical protein C2G38_2046829 [Gigaspora rosea]